MLIGRLHAAEVDASGVDVSAIDLADMSVLEGVVWTEETTWPDGVREQVQPPQSDEIRPGVYQVRRGSGRDLSRVTAVHGRQVVLEAHWRLSRQGTGGRGVRPGSEQVTSPSPPSSCGPRYRHFTGLHQPRGVQLVGEVLPARPGSWISRQRPQWGSARRQWRLDRDGHVREE